MSSTGGAKNAKKNCSIARGSTIWPGFYATPEYVTKKVSTTSGDWPRATGPYHSQTVQHHITLKWDYNFSWFFCLFIYLFAGFRSATPPPLKTTQFSGSLMNRLIGQIIDIADSNDWMDPPQTPGLLHRSVWPLRCWFAIFRLRFRISDKMRSSTTCKTSAMQTFSSCKPYCSHRFTWI